MVNICSELALLFFDLLLQCPQVLKNLRCYVFAVLDTRLQVFSAGVGRFTRSETFQIIGPAGGNAIAMWAS